MEKAQKTSGDKEQEGKKKGAVEKGPSGAPSKVKLDDKELAAAVVKLKAITPYALSSQFGIKMGAAKNIIEKMVKKGVIVKVAGCHRIAIYKPLIAAAA